MKVKNYLHHLIITGNTNKKILPEDIFNEIYPVLTDAINKRLVEIGYDDKNFWEQDKNNFPNFFYKMLWDKIIKNIVLGHLIRSNSKYYSIYCGKETIEI